jgi:hypothetical protein
MRVHTPYIDNAGVVFSIKRKHKKVLGWFFVHMCCYAGVSSQNLTVRMCFHGKN